MNELICNLQIVPTKPKMLRIHSPNNHIEVRNPRKRVEAKEKICMCKPPEFSFMPVPPVWVEFRDNSQLCDGVIICDDDVEIKVHRVILSSVSSYFKAHFTNCLNYGSPENTEARVSVPSKIFKKILDFAYTGFCPIEDETVEPLFRAADQYHVLGVIQLCCRYILDQLQPTNCLGILRFARHYFCSELERVVRRYVRSNFSRVLTEGEEFDYLCATEVVEVLQDDELNVKKEKYVFEAVDRWITRNTDERCVYALPLLECVRLPTVKRKFLLEHILTWSIAATNLECEPYLMMVMSIMEANQKPDIDSPIWRARVPHDILFAIGGWSAGSPTNFIETYDVRANTWLLSVDTDVVPRAYHGLCALNGRIYIIGGFDGNEHFNTVRCFDPIEHTWSECACMYYPRCYVSVALHDNKIYAMGGYNGRNRMSSVERYDPRCNQWQLVKPMQRQRSDASAAVVNNKIYIVGGFNGHEVMSSGEVYDTSADQWTFIPQMTTARSGVSLIAFRNTLYALGGFNGYSRLASGEKYCPGNSQTTTWELICDMHISRSNFATAVLDDRIYVVGGFNDRLVVGATTVNHVEFYKAHKNKWIVVAPMNLNRSALSACVLSGLPNAKEYSLMGRSGELGQGAGAPQALAIMEE